MENKHEFEHQQKIALRIIKMLDGMTREEITGVLVIAERLLSQNTILHADKKAMKLIIKKENKRSHGKKLPNSIRKHIYLNA